MIRDLAEETVDVSAFDDFSASSMLAIIRRQIGVCLIGLFKVPMIPDIAEDIVDVSAFDDFSASSIYVGNNRETGWGYV